ncbi:hypothetical protein E2C01_013397 [Portunus trituberculatus]|uniref:Uncharacterized protein n=1 Tax=Portunus trituberculatus TaxID=210409 RepID=A0A5B7DH14_PORTR|nr:hypothetical protein [Portunus trituberculatus]
MWKSHYVFTHKEWAALDNLSNHVGVCECPPVKEYYIYHLATCVTFTWEPCVPSSVSSASTSDYYSDGNCPTSHFVLVSQLVVAAVVVVLVAKTSATEFGARLPRPPKTPAPSPHSKVLPKHALSSPPRPSTTPLHTTPPTPKKPTQAPHSKPGLLVASRHILTTQRPTHHPHSRATHSPRLQPTRPSNPKSTHAHSKRNNPAPSKPTSPTHSKLTHQPQSKPTRKPYLKPTHLEHYKPTHPPNLKPTQSPNLTHPPNPKPTHQANLKPTRSAHSKATHPTHPTIYLKSIYPHPKPTSSSPPKPTQFHSHSTHHPNFQPEDLFLTDVEEEQSQCPGTSHHSSGTISSSMRSTRLVTVLIMRVRLRSATSPLRNGLISIGSGAPEMPCGGSSSAPSASAWVSSRSLRQHGSMASMDSDHPRHLLLNLLCEYQCFISLNSNFEKNCTKMQITKNT